MQERAGHRRTVLPGAESRRIGFMAFSSEVDANSPEENASNERVFGNPMCLLCDDEKAYQAYMNYLDAMERQGEVADTQKTLECAVHAVERPHKARPEQR